MSKVLTIQAREKPRYRLCFVTGSETRAHWEIDSFLQLTTDYFGVPYQTEIQLVVPQFVPAADAEDGELGDILDRDFDMVIELLPKPGERGYGIGIPSEPSSSYNALRTILILSLKRCR